MAKELIISVNGREKKIAILDNGRVTEFYIERGEENSGIAGNIYKGRVQRVLPGMQSAFVSIGLERDAFLYVSDFFDEEEEIERIVMEKSKKGSPDDAKREANDQIERRRLEREKQMESVQEIIEPLAGDAEAVAAAAAEPAQAEKKGRRGRRGRDNEKPANTVEQDDVSDDAATDDAAANSVEENFLEPIFEMAEDHDFERIVDNDDEDPGEMFKDAYRQESIASTVRAIEFDAEPAAETVEVGSLDIQADAAGFERIADEDEEPAAAEKPKRQTRSRRSKKSDETAETAAAKDNEAADETAAEETEEAAKPAKKGTKKLPLRPRPPKLRRRKAAAKRLLPTTLMRLRTAKRAKKNRLTSPKWPFVEADAAAVADVVAAKVMVMRTAIRKIRPKMMRTNLK